MAFFQPLQNSISLEVIAVNRKIGRNSPCSCGSGKKYKKCCGSAVERVEKLKVSEKAVAAFLDEDTHSVVVMTADMVVNQLRRTGPKIAESFDKSFDADVWEIFEQFAQTFALLAHSYKRHVRRKIDSVSVKCGELLLNAAYTVIGALEILRHGFRLQPGILIRNEIETVCVALSLFAEPDWLVEWERGRLESTKTISRAKKVLPFGGILYGYFSREFAHLGARPRFSI
jgi:SEC-C motif